MPYGASLQGLPVLVATPVSGVPAPAPVSRLRHRRTLAGTLYNSHLPDIMINETSVFHSITNF